MLQIVAGWLRNQPGRSAVGGVSTAHSKNGRAQFGMQLKPLKNLQNVISIVASNFPILKSFLF